MYVFKVAVSFSVPHDASVPPRLPYVSHNDVNPGKLMVKTFKITFVNVEKVSNVC